MCIPIVFLLVADLNSFLLGWNVGRGGMLIMIVFLVLDRLEFASSVRISVRRKVLAPVFTVFVLGYYVASVFGGLHDALKGWGEQVKVSLVLSWVWFWDYFVLSVYVSSLSWILHGLRGLKHMASASIYLSGVSVILVMDAMFPYDTLGPLQYMVPLILYVNTGLIGLFGLGSASVVGNVLKLEGSHGVFTFSVFWPSAGVHSVIIYSIIMLVFLSKINMKNLRRISFFVVGVAGTVWVNILRIFLLSAYVLLVSTDPKKFEDFHAIAGEVVFLPWVFLYVFFISWIESKKRRGFNSQKI